MLTRSKLWERTMTLAEHTGITVERIAYFGENKADLEEIEHVLHELSHATLLDIPLRVVGEMLDDRIGDHIRELELNAADENEVLTFSIVRGVMQHYGLPYPREAMLKAVNVNDTRYWTRRRRARRWLDFEKTPECATAISKIVTILEGSEYA